MSWKKLLLNSLFVFACIWIFYSALFFFLYKDKLTDTKIWLHRSNSVEKIKQFEDEYVNFELDLRFGANNRFTVTHDDELTSNSFQDFLWQFALNDARIWLDIKNLTSSNHEKMLDRLITVLDRYDIGKRRVIVESGNWRDLQDFHDAGFYTSYYLPISSYQSLLGEKGDNMIAHIKGVLQTKKIDAISFWGRYYPFVSKFFPDTDLLVWEHRLKREQLPTRPRGRKMLEDKHVKVILVKDKGDYHQ